MEDHRAAPASAIVLAGAVAKGAFEAGALSVLAEHRAALNIVRVIGSSSGALNGAVYAVGIRAAHEPEAAERLERLWTDRGGWHDVLKLRLSDLLHLRGVGTAGNVLEFLMEVTRGWSFELRRHAELGIVLADLSGRIGQIGSTPATTYERLALFRDDDLDTAEGWERICRTAVGSAAFPIVYSPVDVPDVGRCLDGGIVNNTPVKWAAQTDIDRIIIVSPHPAVLAKPSEFEGVELMGEFADILINERLYRDLREAVAVNARLAQLEEFVASGALSRMAAEQVKRWLGWRPLELIQIRPEAPLDGSAFSGFGDQNLRVRYIQSGRKRATEVLQQLESQAGQLS